MPLDNPEFTVYTSSLLEKALQNGKNRHIPEKSLKVVTCQVTLHGNPKPMGSTVLNDDTPHWAPIVTQGCFQDNKVSCSCSGHPLSNTEPTTNSTLLTFIEQVNLYNLQKMVLQFAICFVPTLGYTYMVYTLNN